MDGRAARLKAEKSAVRTALARQRKLIEEFDKQRLGGAAMGFAGTEPTSWEAEQESALEALRGRLEKLQLEGDEFQVLREGGSEVLLSVSARGAVIFFDFKRSPVAVPPPPNVQFYALGVADQAAEQGSVNGTMPVLETRWSTERARRIHELRLVRRDSGGYEGPARVELLWKDGAKQVLRVRRDDDEELEAVLGALLRRFNASRVRVVRRLQQLWTMRNTPFSVAQHLARLTAVASLLLPAGAPTDEAPSSLLGSPSSSNSPRSANTSDKPPTPSNASPAAPGSPSSRSSTPTISGGLLPSGNGVLWRKLGFSADPASELRPLGILGLHCLEEASRTSFAPSAVLRPLWAHAALCACAALMRLLALRDNLIRSAPADESWETPLFIFLCSCGNEEAFESVYAMLLQLYLTMQATRPGTAVTPLMDAATAALDDALRRQPESLEQLRAWLL